MPTVDSHEKSQSKLSGIPAAAANIMRALMREKPRPAPRATAAPSGTAAKVVTRCSISAGIIRNRLVSAAVKKSENVLVGAAQIRVILGRPTVQKQLNL